MLETSLRVCDEPVARERQSSVVIIDGLGATALLAMIAAAVLSWCLAATQPPLDPGTPHTRWFEQLEPRLAWLPVSLRSAFHGAGPFATERWFLVGYCVPLALCLGCAIALIARLVARRDRIGEREARRVLAWAIVFAAAAVPAFNVLTQDIWLSVAWGRMLLRGENPFGQAFSLALAADLPLEYDPMPMTYGPGWALVCAFCVGCARSAPLASWFVLKLVLGAAWVLCLRCVSELARPRGAFRQALAVAFAGWLPCGWHGVAEGHNDVVMAAAALLWLGSLARASRAAPLALAASVLTKYVTAPLALVDFVYARLRVMRYLVRVLPAACLVGASAVWVAASVRGFGVTSSMREWQFLDPADVFRWLGRYTGRATGTLGLAFVCGVFAFAMLAELRALAREASADRVQRASLATMALVLFTVVGHVWPWYFVWCAPIAALVPEFWLARFVLVAASLAPFTIVHWWRFGTTGALRSELPSCAMYGAALAVSAGYAVVRRRRSPHVASSTLPNPSASR